MTWICFQILCISKIDNDYLPLWYQGQWNNKFCSLNNLTCGHLIFFKYFCLYMVLRVVFLFNFQTFKKNYFHYFPTYILLLAFLILFLLFFFNIRKTSLSTSTLICFSSFSFFFSFSHFSSLCLLVCFALVVLFPCWHMALVLFSSLRF